MSALRQWYVVHTHPNAEGKAVANLVRQGFAIYWPRYLKRRRHARRVETVAAPLFPRYLFVSIDMAWQRWRSINSTIGISRLVCNGDEPAVVDDAVIKELKQREAESGYIELPSLPQFARGDCVRVVDGLFTSCLGIFEGMTDHQRVSVLLDLLGRKARVIMDAELISAA